MAQRKEIVNVLNALDSLSPETLNSLTNEELNELRDKLRDKTNDLSLMIRGRIHCKHYCFPEDK